MQLNCCDICESIIEDKIYVMAITESFLQKTKTQYEDTKSFEDSMKVYNRLMSQHQKNTKVFDLCPGCQKVLGYLLGLRKGEVKKLKEKAKKIYEKGTNNGEV